MAKENKINKVITIALVVVILIAAITVLYLNLPREENKETSPGGTPGENEQESEVMLQIIYKDDYINYTLDELEAMESYTGIGGYRTRQPSIKGQGNYTGVPVTVLVELIAGDIENYSIIATANYKNEIENKTYNYSYIMGNVDIYNPDNASDETPIDNGGLTMVLAYKYEGKYLNESKDGKLKIAFLDESGSITSSGLWWKSVISIEIIEQ